MREHGIRSGRAANLPHVWASKPYESAGLNRALTPAELKYSIAQHRLFDRLPSMFRSEKGRVFVVVSTSDLTKTLLFLPRERGEFLKGFKIREITADTIAD